jgi:hypothetical protein
LPNPLPDGPVHIDVTATDPAGNTSDPTEVDVKVDTQKPEAPKVTNPADGTTIDPNTPKVEGEAEPGSTVTVDAGNGNKCTTVAAANGKFSCTLPNPLPDGPVTIDVTATDPAGNVSDKTSVTVSVDREGPLRPTVNTSDPTQIGGKTSPNETVTVTDKAGQELCRVKADVTGAWSCVPSKPLKPGDEITVTATDAAGRTASLTVRVLGIDVVVASVVRGEKQSARGLYFRPGERVTAVMHSQDLNLGAAVADADGTVTFTWTVPADSDLGSHTVVLTGETSGPIAGDFLVTTPMSQTGSTVNSGHVTAAFLSLLVGLGLLIVARRRREESEARPGRAL